MVLLVFLLLAGVFGAAMATLIRARLGDRRAALADPLNLPAPRRRISGIVFGLLFVWGGVMIVRSGRQIGTAPASPDSVPPGALALLMVLPLTLVVGLVALRVARQLRNPLLRAVLRARRGDPDGAIAAVRAEMARHAAQLQAPGAGDDAIGNLWAPPSAPGSDPHRRALADGWNTLGVIEASRKDWASALRSIEQAERVDPARAVSYRANRGGALIELGRPAEAIPLIRETIAALPGSASWNRSIYLILLAQALHGDGQPDAARRVLDHAERIGRQSLVFPRSSKREWRGKIDDLRGRLEAPTATPTPTSPPTPDPAGAG